MSQTPNTPTNETHAFDETQPACKTSCGPCPGRLRVWAWLIALGAGVTLAYAWSQSGIGSQHALIDWQVELDRAMAQSGESGKPVLMKFTADWCGPCRQMKREVFSDPGVGALIQGSFIPVVVDVTDRSGPGQDIANRYRVEALPTLVVIDAYGMEQARKIGYIHPPQLHAWLSPLAVATDTSPTLTAQPH